MLFMPLLAFNERFSYIFLFFFCIRNSRPQITLYVLQKVQSQQYFDVVTQALPQSIRSQQIFFGWRFRVTVRK